MPNHVACALRLSTDWILIRRRKEKTERNRAPIQDDVSKKPVNDFGSKSLSEYLLGSRKMKPFPVAMSLVARYLSNCWVFFRTGFYFDCNSLILLINSQFNDLMFVAIDNSYISGVTILGTPAEIYSYGTQYWLIIVAIILMGFVVSYVYLPVFTTLRVGSSYEVMWPL